MSIGTRILGARKANISSQIGHVEYLKDANLKKKS